MGSKMMIFFQASAAVRTKMPVIIIIIIMVA